MRTEQEKPANTLPATKRVAGWTADTFAGPFRFIELLGGKRDTVLVGVGIVYGSGYLVWSINAWRNDLGILPAADFQYLVAGLLSMLAFTIAWIMLRIGLEGKEKTKATFARKTKSQVERVRLRLAAKGQNFRRIVPLLIILGYLWAVGGLATSGLLLALHFEGWFLVSLFVWIILLSLLDLLFWSLDAEYKTSDSVDEARSSLVARAVSFWVFLSRSVSSAYLGPVATGQIVLSTVITLVLSLVLSVVVVYPRLPQELGGTRPRCAYLELAISQVSQETVTALMRDQDTSTFPEIVRTPQMDLMYSRGDLVLVRLRHGSADSNRQIFELRGDVIHAIVGCDDQAL